MNTNDSNGHSNVHSSVVANYLHNLNAYVDAFTKALKNRLRRPNTRAAILKNQNGAAADYSGLQATGRSTE